MRPSDAERGAALLTVLLLVAVIAVIAAGALEKLRLATRLTANAVGIEQARSYAQAAETLAVTRITTLLGQNPGRVTLAGGWSNAPFGLPLPGGTAVARVSDGGNCFNLNSLVTEPVPGVYANNPLMRLQFARLMRLLQVSPQIAEQVAAGASDWIDSDTDQQAGGAEDNAYLGQDPGYRTASTLMMDPSELRAVAGVTAELYAQLKPWLCTLPTARPAPINLNTLAPEQAPLVAMLAPDTLTVDAARAALLQRPVQGWASTSALPGLSGVALGEGAGVTSRWFALRVDVVVNGLDLRETALIDATRLPARLVSRQWGEE
ncbi:type II secretion system minor pseudopilin GspK [Sphingomonas sp.]|jgi:general secretion pathway protein K|uniref:type II secretion system minor pseudopilin GspK n=1 Tax=Sphingomonas sp. TaxID=28214 RepID=UPI002D8093FC|nr:type II secretion system minor pseudopilin GspK [Sphingomonas sp.]HEU0043769.1 type II secretion system minor pseudopilin GspK [Sphingomonas sp.]